MISSGEASTGTVTSFSSASSGALAEWQFTAENFAKLLPEQHTSAALDPDLSAFRNAGGKRPLARRGSARLSPARPPGGGRPSGDLMRQASLRRHYGVTTAPPKVTARWPSEAKDQPRAPE